MAVWFAPPSPLPVNCIAPPSPILANGTPSSPLPVNCITPPFPLPANGAPQRSPQDAQASAPSTPLPATGAPQRPPQHTAVPQVRIDHAGLSPSAARSTPRRFFESALARRPRRPST
ncbi:hypothetical protein SETIT_2G183400v2 [Setaria italica]|uniref:Uncharacterized protein n=1 Tax=Setaria italica TaxID=4555 RepID=A0A368Q048_SETIT|nr:hypothetical protein SETIT_2G183400v2 [Setaria italica]